MLADGTSESKDIFVILNGDGEFYESKGPRFKRHFNVLKTRWWTKPETAAKQMVTWPDLWVGCHVAKITMTLDLVTVF